MGSDTRRSFRINIFCSILVVAFLVCVPIVSAWTSLGAGRAGATEASAEIKADPLGRLPSSPEEAHKRVQKREVGWPGNPAVDGGRSADSVQSGVHVSIPYDTVSGRTTHNNSAVKIEHLRSAVVIQTVNATTDGTGWFTADLSSSDIQSGDTVRVTDMIAGAPVDIDCTLTGSIDTSTDVVSGTAASGTAINVYICTPSTILGDVPPGSAHKTSTGPSWSTNFATTIDLRTGDAAFFYATDSNSNVVMGVADTGGSLVVYPQYDDVLGFYQPSTLLTVHAGSASMNVGTAKDGFFEAWFTGHDILPGQLVSCNMATNRSITVADITAKCDPATNHVSGKGPANRLIRVTMNPYGGSAAVYQSTTDSQGNFNVALGSRYTATGSDVYNVAWYNSNGDAVVYEFQTFSWHLAEGYTGLTPGGGGFDTYVLIQNPGTQDATVTMTFQLQSGKAAAKYMTVPAGTRTTVHLNDLPGLADASVSTKVTSTNGASLNAERAMYFNYTGKTGGHDSIGVLTPSKTWYLAEGYTGTTPGGGTFDTWVLVQNPGTVNAHVTMQFQLQHGTGPDLKFVLPAGTRQSILLNRLPGLAGVSVSTKVTSDVDVVTERAMYFSYEGKTDGSDSIGVTTPGKVWYMAEGYTGAGFDTWVLVQNPSAASAHVTLKFQLESGNAPDYAFDLPARTRQSVHLNELPGLTSGASVSTKVTSDVDVVAERAMYFDYNGKDGGHTSNAAFEPSRGWYLPEGYTGGTPHGGSFDTWVLVQNPGTTSAHVTLKFQLESGNAPDDVFDLPAGTRQSILLNKLPGLAGVSVSTAVTASVPVVAERSMYFNYYGLDGGSNSIGIPFTP